VSAVGTAGGAPGGPGEPRHGRRIATIWVVATAIVVPLVIWVVGPHIPPGHSSQQASDQHVVNVVLTALAAPVLLFIWVYFGYAVAVFRHRRDEVLLDGPPIEGDARLQLIWLAITSVIVLGLAAYGTTDLFTKAGAGGGEGPNPIAKPAAAPLRNALQVQVIGQQWLWTFRYPGYGGVETPTLELPVNREIVFHVTSLDVAHSFWAYELAVKADAIPGNDNVAYVVPTSVRTFQIRCAELCGLWHGHMNLTGRVVNQGDFATWIAQQQAKYAGVTKQLPPYSLIYYPQPIRRAG
jgi:cytochrome c oxidase subunit 2